MNPLVKLGRLAQRAALLGFALTLSACAWFGRGEPDPPPLPATVGGVSPRLAWSVAVGPGGVGLRPAVAGNGVYAAATDGTVVRIDAATGRVVWRVSVGAGLSAGASSDGEQVVVAGRDGEVIAIDANDGRVRWRVPVGPELLSPPVIGFGVVVVRAGERIVALEAQGGQQRWVWSRPLPALVLRQPAPVALASVAAAGQNLAFAGLPGGRLVALSLDKGAVRWEAPVTQARGTNEIERIADVLGQPWVDGREVCAAAYQGRIACQDAASGAPLWSRDLSAWSGLNLDARYAFAPDDRGNLYAVRRPGGELAWRSEALAMRRLSQPLSMGASVLVGDRAGTVHWFARETGAPQARRAIDAGPILAPLVAAGNLAIAQTVGGSVVAFATD